MRAHWTVPRMWEGEQVAIFASGPSMNRRTVEAARIAGMKTIAINRTIELAPDADMLYASDGGFWNYYKPQMKGLKVSVFCDGNKSRRSQLPPDDVLMLKNSGFTGFDPDPSCIRTGKNGGHAALHVAAHTGARQIFLFGYDMHGGHWHGRYPVPLRNTKPEQYVAWAPMFAELAAALRQRGIEVFNCTPGSALRAFQMLDFFDAAVAA